MDVSDLMDLKAYVGEKLEGKIDEAEIAYEELNLTTSADNIVAVMKFLRDATRGADLHRGKTTTLR